MTRPQSPLQDPIGAVEPGFADLPAFLAARKPHDAIQSDPQARLEASPADARVYDSERLPTGRRTRPGEH
ncbi:hypothetical protein [Cognatilysobacter bugurensis]|uniref:Uncharacterized protein n=1 Tax=Cognatilysobacter bugurensis TaxID=543356 RepID=A0A918SWM5_9GAMM|nr:hypothetical protein [Lysobacter bugurensis]GHA72774.1 hypothetical protein GCM10007067_06700 [Lysobacter bugurensis]